MNVRASAFGPLAWKMIYYLSRHSDPRRFKKFMMNLYLPCSRCRSSYGNFISEVIHEPPAQLVRSLHGKVNRKLGKPPPSKIRRCSERDFYSAAVLFFAFVLYTNPGQMKLLEQFFELLGNPPEWAVAKSVYDQDKGEFISLMEFQDRFFQNRNWKIQWNLPTLLNQLNTHVLR